MFFANKYSVGDEGELWTECFQSHSNYLPECANAEAAIFVHENACEEMAFELIAVVTY